MHRLVAVVNMDESRFVALQQLDEIMPVIRPRLPVDRIRRRPVFHDVFEPETQDEIPARPGPGEFGEPDDRIEGKQILVLVRLRVDDGAQPAQPRHLTVDALHFRLEKGAAERDDERSGVGGVRHGQFGSSRREEAQALIAAAGAGRCVEPPALHRRRLSSFAICAAASKFSRTSPAAARGHARPARRVGGQSDASPPAGDPVAFRDEKAAHAVAARPPGMPPCRVAITGSPVAMASSMELGTPSWF